MEQELLKAIREIMKEELKPIKAELEGVKSDVEGIKSRLDEHTQILQALRHTSEVNAAERDKMANDIAHIKSDTTHIKAEIADLRENMNQVEIVTSRNWNEIAKLKAVKL